MKKEVYVVYEGDQWLSTSSLEVKAVCSSWDSMMNAVVDIAKEYGMKGYEELSDDECMADCIESVDREFNLTKQYLGRNFGITFEVFELDVMPYSV